MLILFVGCYILWLCGMTHVSPFIHKDGEKCTCETLATSPTTTRCYNPSTELTPIINHQENIAVVTHTI
jgi:hypothetical protein